ncbi:MAG: LPS assembly lipoprotein LptE [Hyphomicrobiaceae bacterium]
MSSCDQRRLFDRPARSGTRAMFGVALIAALIGGCADGSGFRPLYGPTGSGASMQSALASVEIAAIPSRVGQRIRNELIFQNTGGGDAAPREYRLQIGIKESLNSSLVKGTGEALSQVYNLEAIFTLVRISDKKVMLKGNSYARAEFERFHQIYSNVRAKEDAENRAANQIADDIRTRIAIALSRNKV